MMMMMIKWGQAGSRATRKKNRFDDEKYDREEALLAS
jgi:predicted DNA-binding WGR domain protein